MVVKKGVEGNGEVRWIGGGEITPQPGETTILILSLQI
tara:strand:+ start:9971 stop:10084 length:114 start_codon:yes stop_codon:yes gene_type:complete